MELLEPAAVRERIERLLRGEQIEREVEIEAGRVPPWYGARSAAEIAALWLGWMATAAEIDRAFYQAGAIGWASRR